VSNLYNYNLVCADCFLPELWILSYPEESPVQSSAARKEKPVFDPSVAKRTKEVVTFFAAGNLADQLSTMSKEEVVEKALDQLDEMFGSEVRLGYVKRK
jgi:protoporphyrinogen oxidase